MVLVCLVGLAYTAFVIKNEKKSYQDSAQSFNFLHFLLPLPSWWAIKEKKEDLIRFYRADTRYEWEALFQWVPSKISNPEELIEKRISFKEIKIDKLTMEFQTKETLKLSKNLQQDKNIDIARVEGTASTSEFERIYYDCFIICDPKRQGYLLCESISSVLNGLVEGPYFEQVIEGLTLND